MFSVINAGSFGVIIKPPLLPKKFSGMISKVSDKLVCLRELAGAQQIAKVDPSQQVSIQPLAHLKVDPNLYRPLKKSIQKQVDIDIIEPHQIIYPNLGYSMKKLMDIDLVDEPAWKAFTNVVHGILHFNRFGILHMDVKLDNIMIGPIHQPEAFHGRLIDYGLVTPMKNIEDQPASFFRQILDDFHWNESCYYHWTPTMYLLDQTPLTSDDLDNLAGQYLQDHPMTEWMAWTTWELVDFLRQLQNINHRQRIDYIAQSWDLYSLGVVVYELAQHLRHDQLLYISEQLVDFDTSITTKILSAESLTKIEL